MAEKLFKIASIRLLSGDPAIQTMRESVGAFIVTCRRPQKPSQVKTDPIPEADMQYMQPMPSLERNLMLIVAALAALEEAPIKAGSPCGRRSR
jgi:hypothetical protein